MTGSISDSSAKEFAPAAERNREPILEVLREWAPASGRVLEIACGTGQHASFFSHGLPHLQWRPSDRTDQLFGSVAAWGKEAGPGWEPPMVLDVTSEWDIPQVDMIVCINMIHIAPWEACEALMGGAGKHLPVGGVLMLYGPFREESVQTTESNEAFDRWLREKDARFGIRQLEDVEALAGQHGLAFEARREMPANNLCVLFRKQAPVGAS